MRRRRRQITNFRLGIARNSSKRKKNKRETKKKIVGRKTTSTTTKKKTNKENETKSSSQQKKKRRDRNKIKQMTIALASYWLVTEFQRLYRTLLGFTEFFYIDSLNLPCLSLIARISPFFLPSFTEMWKGSIRSFWVLLGFNGFYLVLQGFQWLYWVLQGFNRFCLVLLGFDWFYWVLLGCTGFQ